VRRSLPPALLAACLLSMALPPAPALAHDLQYAVEPGRALVVRLFYSDSARFSYEGYEVFRGDETVPFQVGRTDALGRLAVLPDRAGRWRIKATSGDGHGVNITVEVDAAAVVTAVDRPLFDRYARVLTGVGLLFGLFGLLSLYHLRRKEAPR
jgi:nickel transport protein